MTLMVGGQCFGLFSDDVIAMQIDAHRTPERPVSMVSAGQADVGGAQHDVGEHPTERADRACESDQRTRHAARPRRLLVAAPSGSNAECERTAKLFAVLRHTFTFDEGREGGSVVLPA
jgi:hypothetical protein